MRVAPLRWVVRILAVTCCCSCILPSAHGQPKSLADGDVAGRRVNYLEIYQGDVLSTDMQPTLEYAASLFHQPYR
jgi:hypothetical protein